MRKKILITLILSATAGLLALLASFRHTPSDTWTLNANTEEWILFSCSSPLGDASELYAVKSNGSSLQRLTNMGGRIRSPRWSPDHKWITFSFSNPRSGFVDDHSERIYKIRSDGSDLTLLTQKGFPPEEHASWSPNGDMIVFQSHRRDGSTSIFVMNPDGENIRQLIDGLDTQYNDPLWSPNGTWIVAKSFHDDGRGELYLLASENGTVSRLTNNVETQENILNWHPGGKLLLFASSLNETTKLFLLSIDNQQIVPLLESLPHSQVFADWSPNGEKIAFLSNHEDGITNIYIMDESTNISRISPNLDCTIDSLEWAP